MAGVSSSDGGPEESPVQPADRPPGRLRRYGEEMRARLDWASAAAESRRGRSRAIDTGLRVVERNRIFPASVIVGAMASRIVIFVIPALALVVFSFGLYAGMTSGDVAESAERMGMAGLFAKAAQDSESMSQGLRFAAIVAISYATLYAANSLGRLVRRSSALIWGVPYERAEKPWALPLIVVGTSALAWFLATLGRLANGWSWQFFVMMILVELAALALLWMLVSRSLPHDPRARAWSDFLPGAVFVAIGIVAMRLAMVLYLAPASAGLYERYGSIGIALVMLTWAYWLGLIIVGSAELDAALFKSRLARPTRHGGMESGEATR